MFANSIRLFRLFAVEVKLDASWLPPTRRDERVEPEAWTVGYYPAGPARR